MAERVFQNRAVNKNESNFAIPIHTEKSIIEKTMRLLVNLLTNILMVLVVFVCLLYTCTSWRPNSYQLHIVLCVLGYQFFMCQGTLILSKYNSWSMYLNRRYRRHLHWIFQMIGIVLVIAGSSLMIEGKLVNFNSVHGILGLCALITSILGLFNGLLAMYSYKLTWCLNAYCIRFIHYVTGIGTLLLSAACLCSGFDKTSFKMWAGYENTILLMVVTCLFTVLVAMDFWIATSNRIRNRF